MPMTRTLSTSAVLWTVTLGSALAQQTNPAPPIPETGPAGSNSAAANAAATDFNWIWLSLVIAVVALAVWYVVRRRQSGNIR
jgi:hypothetical protein